MKKLIKDVILQKIMLPSIHFIASLILAIILFPFFGFYSFIVLISGFFIDFDHILFYWFRFKSFNLNRAYNYFRDITLKRDIKEYKKVFRIFHSVEFITLISILTFYHKIFLILLIGLIIHIIMDIIHDYPKFKTLKPLSLIWYLKNVKEQKK